MTILRTDYEEHLDYTYGNFCGPGVSTLQKGRATVKYGRPLVTSSQFVIAGGTILARLHNWPIH